MFVSSSLSSSGISSFSWISVVATGFSQVFGLVHFTSVSALMRFAIVLSYGIRLWTDLLSRVCFGFRTRRVSVSMGFDFVIGL